MHCLHAHTIALPVHTGTLTCTHWYSSTPHSIDTGSVSSTHTSITSAQKEPINAGVGGSSSKVKWVSSVKTIRYTTSIVDGAQRSTTNSCVIRNEIDTRTVGWSIKQPITSS